MRIKFSLNYFIDIVKRFPIAALFTVEGADGRFILILSPQ